MEVIKEYKVGYKKTKFGWILEDWKLMKLSDIAVVKRGAGSQYLEYCKEKDSDSIRLIRIGDFVKNDPKFIKISNDIKRFVINEGDLLIAGTGATAGIVFIVPKAFHGLAFSYNAPRIRVKEGFSNIFLYHFLKSNFILKQQNALFAGNAQPFLDTKAIGGFKLFMPPFAEQQKIATILSDWDEAIQKTQNLIKKLKIRKKGLMQQLLTGKTRLNGFSEEWKEFKLGEVTVKFSNRNKKLIDAKVYSVTNDRGFILQTDMFAREVAGEDLSGYKIIEKDEFAYNPARVNVGSIALFEDEIGIISSLYVCFRTNKKLLNRYLINLLETAELKHKIIRYGEGGVRIYLWYYLFEAIKVNLPSIEEQKAILEILDAADTEIEQQQNYLEQLLAQKKGLMQQLLTGKIRVKI